MSVPRIGAKMSANAAPTQAPAQRPAASDDQDTLLLSADDHEVLLLSGYDQELSIEDEPDGDPIDEKGVEGCIDEGCIADEWADAELVESVRVGEYGSRDEYSGAVGIMWSFPQLSRALFGSRHDWPRVIGRPESSAPDQV
jgi:hypothetical protein